MCATQFQAINLLVLAINLLVLEVYSDGPVPSVSLLHWQRQTDAKRD